MAKLINLKSEMQEAQHNAAQFKHIKSEAIRAFNKFPTADRETIVQTLCKHNEMTIDTFRFVLSVENQMLEDALISNKWKSK